jgi:hypothetical protein
VPVALNLYEIREDKGSAGDFFRAVQKQRPDQYQGVYVVSPDGTVLASHGKMVEPTRKWAGEIVNAIAAALEKAGPLPAREETRGDAPTDRGVGFRAGGEITLAAYTRPMVLGLDRRGLGDRAIDSIALNATDVSKITLASDLPPGTKWKLPKETVVKFHKLLSPASDANTLARADEMTEATLEVKVEKVAGAVAYVSLRGRVAGEHVWRFEPHRGKKIRAYVTLVGVGSVSTASGQLLSLTLVGDGRYRNHPPYDREEQKYGAVAEWRRD